MRLRDGLVLFAVVMASLMLAVLWTEYAYQRGVDAATYECDYGEAS